MTRRPRCGSTIYAGRHRYETCGRRARFEVNPRYGTERERFACGYHAKAWLVDVLRPLDDRAAAILARRRARKAEAPR